MWIALRGDLNKDFQRMLKKMDSSLTQDCRRGMFLSRLSIDIGSWNCYFGEVDKYLKPFPVVGNSPTAETPRNRRDPGLCWRELLGGWVEHTVSWPAEPRFAAQGQTGWLAWRWEGQKPKALGCFFREAFWWGEGRRSQVRGELEGWLTGSPPQASAAFILPETQCPRSRGFKPKNQNKK